MIGKTPQPHALIIEDELLSGMILQMHLTDVGYRSFAFAGTQRQALEQAQLHRPDLLTVDVGLLDGDGLGAADAILEICGPLPVVFVTGDPARVEHPAAQVVEKPVRGHEFARAVQLARATPLRSSRPETSRPHGPVI